MSPNSIPLWMTLWTITFPLLAFKKPNALSGTLTLIFVLTLLTTLYIHLTLSPHLTKRIGHILTKTKQRALVLLSLPLFPNLYKKSIVIAVASLQSIYTYLAKNSKLSTTTLTKVTTTTLEAHNLLNTLLIILNRRLGTTSPVSSWAILTLIHTNFTNI